MPSLIDLCRAVENADPLAELPSIAERRRMRRAAGLSIDLAAALVGISDETLRAWEIGAHKPLRNNERTYRKFLAACRRLAA